MGQPKSQRKKYDRPKKPWDKTRIDEEKKMSKTFGLRRKREIWKAETIIRNLRRRARKLQARRDEAKIKELMNSAYNMGLVDEKAELDDILGLEERNLLVRRLQTVIKEKGIANSLKHARQLITHGHVLINDRRIKWPGMIIKRDVEPKIRLDNKMQTKGVNNEERD